MPATSSISSHCWSAAAPHPTSRRRASSRCGSCSRPSWPRVPCRRPTGRSGRSSATPRASARSADRSSAWRQPARSARASRAEAGRAMRERRRQFVRAAWITPSKIRSIPSRGARPGPAERGADGFDAKRTAGALVISCAAFGQSTAASSRAGAHITSCVISLIGHSRRRCEREHPRNPGTLAVFAKREEDSREMFLASELRRTYRARSRRTSSFKRSASMQHPRAVVLSFAIVSAAYLGSFTLTVEGQGAAEAPAGFDNTTNGLVSQAQFDLDRATFEERDEIADGLGPVYNAQSCAECHQSPITGAISQISELRAGHFDGAGNFVDGPGGSLFNERAINAAFQERVPGAENVRTLRMSTNTLGDGFVEAIDSNTLVALANAQPGRGLGIAGQALQVPVAEAGGALRVGRFGWKNQHASLLSFSGDAYLNEVGITNRFNLIENTSLGRSVAGIDTVSDAGPSGEDADNDIDVF